MVSRESGFTLIELMIVTAIVSIIAGVAVPNLVSSRAVANERAVVATLRTISTAQTQCQARAVLDVDHDGRGEALGLAELAGMAPLRDGSAALTPTALATSLGTLDAAGYAGAKGYMIALYVPDAAGDGVLATTANAAAIDTDQAEIAWSCVAWPRARGRSGTSTFYINQTGEILVAKDANYNGTTSIPAAGAAMTGVPATNISSGQLAADSLGADGNTWRLLR